MFCSLWVSPEGLPRNPHLHLVCGRLGILAVSSGIPWLCEQLPELSGNAKGYVPKDCCWRCDRTACPACSYHLRLPVISHTTSPLSSSPIRWQVQWLLFTKSFWGWSSLSLIYIYFWVIKMHRPIELLITLASIFLKMEPYVWSWDFSFSIRLFSGLQIMRGHSGISVLEKWKIEKNLKINMYL